MTATATNRSFASAGPSLAETISSFCVEFRALKAELRAALQENWAMRRELAAWRARVGGPRGGELGALRRRVAFYCHPDRGGDAQLMSALNALFDALEGGAPPPTLSAAQGG